MPGHPQQGACAPAAPSAPRRKRNIEFGTSWRIQEHSHLPPRAPAHQARHLRVVQPRAHAGKLALHRAAARRQLARGRIVAGRRVGTPLRVRGGRGRGGGGGSGGTARCVALSRRTSWSGLGARARRWCVCVYGTRDPQCATAKLIRATVWKTQELKKRYGVCRRGCVFRQVWEARLRRASGSPCSACNCQHRPGVCNEDSRRRLPLCLPPPSLVTWGATNARVVTGGGGGADDDDEGELSASSVRSTSSRSLATSTPPVGFMSTYVCSHGSRFTCGVQSPSSEKPIVVHCL